MAKKKKLFETLLGKVVLYLEENRSWFSKSKIIKALEIKKKEEEVLPEILDHLLVQGFLTKKGNKYRVPQIEEGKEIVRGTISVHPRGFGFVNRKEADIFVPKSFVGGAIDGDVVDLKIQGRSARGPEGEVIAVVERSRKRLAGVVVSLSKGLAHVYSSLLGEFELIPCKVPNDMRVNSGDRVVLEVQEWGQREPKSAVLSRVLGPIADPATDIPYSIIENNLRDTFSAEVIEEASSFGQSVGKKEIEQRVDLRDLECITIDPDTAKDFDDAVSLEKTSSGYRLGVHIADVSHYVTAGSALDQEASLRCNSTYFPNMCIPMLPKELSENLCSLRPNVNRLTVSVFITLDKKGQTVSWEIVRSVIKSKKRFTYKEAKEVLDGQIKSPYKALLNRLAEVCALLQKERTKRGSVQLYVPEVVVKIDVRGAPIDIELIEYDITHQMIEECMLKANEVVAIHLAKQGKDLSYRVHESPSDESLENFSQIVSSFGFALPEKPSTHDIQEVFLKIGNSKHAPFLALAYIKSMRQACYSADNIGHYGLSLEHYCHFTSPIRRYVDLIVHRLLFDRALDRKAIDDVSLKASERERVSARAENSVRLVKKLRLLKKYIEEKPKKVFKAVITAVKPFGIFFDVSPLLLEGFIHISELGADYYVFYEDNELVGEYSGESFRCGQKIAVRCLSVDLTTLETMWRLI